MGHALGNNYGKSYSFQSKPVWLDLQFQVAAADTGGFGVINVKGQGVRNVYMHTSQTPAVGNPNPAVGYALIRLNYNYARAYCLNHQINSPVTGSNLAINASALTPGLPYQITSVGAGTAGTATIAPVADSAGSLASTYFLLFDGYGNTFVIWFSVAGVGSRPNLGPESAYGTQGLHYVQQSIASGATAAQIGTALAVTIAALPSGISGVFSFYASGTTTVTVVSTALLPIAGVPADGVSPLGTGFTFALTKFVTNLQDWQAVGVPKGVTPAVGVSFIATAAGFSTGGASTGLVKAIGVSGVGGIEMIGDPNLSIGPIPMAGSPNDGGWLLVQFLIPTATIPVAAGTAGQAVTNNAGVLNSSGGEDVPTVVSFAPAAPADTSIVKMTILLEQAARVGGNQE